ncbi:DUF5606 family protein [Mangrovibacterium diazotrophicum]|uniref:Uncharacterized protein n=1 Tax=Mangrovibacterium diazotrophicum TaxID=1261403 RepID=A0A419VYI5_9BACT|nr:DUF5606 domain-containing protein [Mangrovibacterium diazotrophicum]RKD88219.1 hypothetical protein BC643_3363 [Mangrovibacterium diazotrophicum]
MLKGILSISGQPGLFKLVAEAKSSIIVESLLTGKRQPAYSTSKISSLEDIAIFTQTGEVALKEVLKSIAEKQNGAEVGKLEGNALKAYFGEVLPEYDQDRVYTSDMKKVIQWYNLLLKNDLLNFDEEAEVEETKDEEK